MAKCPYCGDEYDNYSDHIVKKHPITCGEVRGKLSDYSRGKLDEETDERVICHISGCKSCDDALQKFTEQQIQATK